jgi:hypothetical protein
VVIHLSVRRIKPENRADVEEWLGRVGSQLRAQAVETLIAEGVTHETAVILDTSDGPVIVYAMETDDIDRARAVGAASASPIDDEHHRVMRAADAGAVPHRIVLDLRAEGS